MKTKIIRTIYRRKKGARPLQADVAKALYVTVTAVSKWEKSPSHTLISDLCEILTQASGN
ncbi:MAG: hypothetical protein ACLRSW_13830 [Christensenellaceae bacterium]